MVYSIIENKIHLFMNFTMYLLITVNVFLFEVLVTIICISHIKASAIKKQIDHLKVQLDQA